MIKLMFLLLLILAPWMVLAAEANQSQPNLALPDRRVTFTDKTYGFQIDIPAHFELTGDEAGLLYFQSTRIPGMIVVRPTPGMDLANVQKLMRGGFESKVTQLKTKGSPLTLDVSQGQGMAMAVEGFLQQQPVSGYLAGIFGAGGQGYMVLVGAVTNKWPILEPESLSILGSFGLIARQPGYEYERWDFRLRGKRLVFVEGYGRVFDGAMFGADISLCSDGQFRGKRGTATYDHDPLWGSYETYSSTRKSGTWTIGQEGLPYVRVDFKRSGYRIAAIEEKDGYVFLDGLPYQAVPNGVCD